MNMTKSQAQKFELSVSKLSSIINGRSQDDSALISCILDDLNSLDFKQFPLKPEKAALCIHHLCSLISCSDVALVSKCCLLIVKLISKQKISVDGRALNYSVQWCLEATKLSGSSVLPDILRSLEVLLRSDDLSNLTLLSALFDLLIQPIESNYKSTCSLEIKLTRLRCLQHLLPFLNDQQCDTFLLKVLLLLQKSDEGSNDSLFYIDLLQCGLDIVKELGTNKLLYKNLGSILGICLFYSSCGLPGAVSKAPPVLFPTPSYQYQLQPEKQMTDKPINKKSGKVRLRKRKKLKEDIKLEENLNDSISNGHIGQEPHVWSQTSDSDFSDSEMGRLSKLRKFQSHVRLSALLLLYQTIQETEPKDIFGYWSALFDGQQSLLQVLLKDPSKKVTSAVITIISNLFSNSKFILAQAQQSERNETAAFISFSTVIAELLCHIHNQLCLALKRLPSFQLFPSLLHCISTLIMNTPYHRLKPGLLTNLVQNLYPTIFYKETDVIVAVITCLSTVAAIEPQTEEQVHLISCSNPINLKSKPDKNEDKENSWILTLAIKALQDKTTSTPVRIEYLQLFKILAKHNHSILTINNLRCLCSILIENLNETDNAAVQLHSINAFEQISSHLNNAGLISFNVEIWTSLLQGPLVPLFKEVKGQLPAAACDCLTSLGGGTFSELSPRLRELCIFLAFNCVSHEEASVRAAAFQVIGLFSNFPLLMDDVQFVSDASKSIVDGLNDKSLFARMKSSWALANLSDIFLSQELIRDSLSVPKLLKTCMTAAQDNDKVKCHGVRALGNILRILSRRDLLETTKDDIELASKILVNASLSSLMKVRWNSCYAMGNMLKNENLHSFSSEWQSEAFKILSQLVLNCTNFKVRLTASAALMAVPSRELYKDHYLPLWPTLLQALENSQSIVDFTEYKHQHSLIDQIVLSISHLAKLSKLEDLDGIHESILLHMDTLKENFLKFHSRVLPEKSSNISEATSHLLSFLDSDNVTNKRTETISILVSVFTNDVL